MGLLREIAGGDWTIKLDGFRLEQEEEREEDNVKIFHDAFDPTGKRHFLDYTPYSFMSGKTFAKFVEFFKKHGRFPTRSDVPGLIGPLRAEDLDKLVEKQ
jgi:hypothetical protein